jgi:hypothetical protein
LGKYYSTYADADRFANSHHFGNPGGIGVPNLCISNSKPGRFSVGWSDARADKFTCSEGDTIAIVDYAR